MTTQLRRHSYLAIAAVLCLTVAACQSGTVSDKTGGGVRTLRLAVIDNLNPDGQTVAHLRGAHPAHADLRHREAHRAQGDDPDHVWERCGYRGDRSGEGDRGRDAGRWCAVAARVRTCRPARARAVRGAAADHQLCRREDDRVRARGPSAAAHTRLDEGHWPGPGSRAVASAVCDERAADYAGCLARNNRPELQLRHQDATIRALGGVPVNASYHYPDLIQAGD